MRNDKNLIQTKKNLATELWLNHLNKILFESNYISEKEYKAMFLKINQYVAKLKK